MVKKILILLVSLAALFGVSFLGKTIIDEKRTIDINNPDVSTSEIEDINILVLGKVGEGQGGQWHTAPDLVDTIFVVNLDKDSGVANLISLPRDLYGDIGDQRIRVNRILYDDKIEDFLNLIPEIIGLEVQRYVVVDLDTVAAIVDSLGGIDVVLPENVVDPISGFTLSKGARTLSGEDATWLIRNRFAPEGDFFREKNQHLVVEAIFAKFNSLSSLGKTAFMFQMLPHVSKSETNFGTGVLLSELKHLDEIEFNSVVLDFKTELLESSIIPVSGGEAYVLTPKEGINQYDKIKEFIQNNLI